MIAANRIKYNNFYSTDFDLIVDVAFDSDNGEISSYLGRDSVSSETYDGRYKRVHQYKYNELFTPKFTFIKNNFEEFTFDEIRRVLSWLTGKSTASVLNVYYDDSDVVTFSCIGGWTEINSYKITTNSTVAIVATFENISPFAFSPVRTVTKTVTGPADNLITINIRSDDRQNQIYPHITIQHNELTSIVEVDHAYTELDEWLPGTVYHYSDGNQYYWVDSNGTKHTSGTNSSGINTTSVTFINQYTDSNNNTQSISSKIANNLKGEEIVFDCFNKVIASSSRPNGRIFGDDFNWTWLPLFYGRNDISVIGNCTITISYREYIKCGEF